MKTNLAEEREGEIEVVGEQWCLGGGGRSEFCHIVTEVAEKFRNWFALSMAYKFPGDSECEKPLERGSGPTRSTFTWSNRSTGSLYSDNGAR